MLTDFEKAVINAVKSEFLLAQSKGSHFHLAQSVYKQIQRNNLTSKYGNDQNFSLLIRHIPALAFLSVLEIPVAFDELKELLLEEAEPIIKWFDDNYVRGRHRRTLKNGQIQRWPPEMWSVFENRHLALPRTQNKIEAWHRRWENLVGRAHVGIFAIIKEIQKEQNIVKNEVERALRGEPAQKMRRDDN